MTAPDSSLKTQHKTRRTGPVARREFLSLRTGFPAGPPTCPTVPTSPLGLRRARRKTLATVVPLSSLVLSLATQVPGAE